MTLNSISANSSSSISNSISYSCTDIRRSPISVSRRSILERLPTALLQEIANFAIPDSSYLNHRIKNGIFHINKNNSCPEKLLLKTRPVAVSEILRAVKGNIGNLSQAARDELKEIGKSIKSLDLQSIPLTPDMVSAIVDYFPKLESLDLADCELNHESVMHIIQLNTLTKLSLRNNPAITNTALQSLGTLQKLLSLDLSFSSLTNDVLDKLATQLPTLQELIFKGCRRLSADCCTALIKFQQLQSLTLQHCRWITTKALTQLVVLQKIKTLALINTPISDDGVALFSQFPELRELDLSFSSHITNLGLTTIVTTLPELTQLRLTSCPNIKENILQKISHLEQLKEVTLPSDTEFNDLSPLSKSLKLQSFGINTAWRDGGGLPQYHFTPYLMQKVLQQLGSFPHLTTITMSHAHNPITDMDIQYLNRCTTVTRLDISHSKITNIGLQLLAQMQTIEELNLEECRKITHDGLEAIAAFSRLRVLNLTNYTYVVHADASFSPALSATGYQGLHQLAKLSNLTRLIIFGWESSPRNNFSHLFPCSILTAFDNAIHDPYLSLALIDLQKKLPSLQIDLNDSVKLLQLKTALQKGLSILYCLLNLPIEGPYSLFRFSFELNSIIQRYMATFDLGFMQTVLYLCSTLCTTINYALTGMTILLLTPICLAAGIISLPFLGLHVLWESFPRIREAIINVAQRVTRTAIQAFTDISQALIHTTAQTFYNLNSCSLQSAFT